MNSNPEDSSASTPALPSYNETEVKRQIKAYATQKEVSRRIAELEAGDWRAPEEGVDAGRLGTLLDVNKEPEPKLIDNILGRKQNAVLVGQYKTGKTRLGLTEMACCVDGEPFLGQETHLEEGGRFAWFNGEMNKGDWDDYIRTLGIENLDDISVMHLRGYRLNLLDDKVAEYVRDWLIKHEVTDWRIDSLRRLLAWSGVQLNDNDGASALTSRIDEIKREAGVQSFVLIAHTGRAQVEPGEERVMGATEWDNWTDVRHILTKNLQGERFFTAVGREVGLEETRLEFDRDTGLYTVSDGPTQNRREVEEENIALAAEAIVGEQPGINSGALGQELGKKFNKSNRNDQSALVSKARASLRIHAHDKGTSKLHFLGAWCEEC